MTLTRHPHWPFAATLALSLLAVAAAGVVRPEPADPLKAGRFDENLYYIQRTHDRELVDAIFVGDSRIQRGIDPSSVFQELAQIRAANLGYSNGSVDREMLEFGLQRLDPEGQKIIVLGISTITFTHLTEGNAQLHEFMGKSRDEVWLARTVPDVLRFFRPVELVTVVRAAIGRPYQPAAYYKQTFHSNGWMESDLNPRDEHRTDESYRDVLSNNAYLPSRETATLDQLRELTARGYHVFALRMPIAPSLLQIEHALSDFDWQAFRSRLTDAGVLWLDPEGAPWQTYDGSHLTAAEARRYSTALGAALHPYFSLGRNP